MDVIGFSVNPEHCKGKGKVEKEVDRWEERERERERVSERKRVRRTERARKTGRK